MTRRKNHAFTLAEGRQGGLCPPRKVTTLTRRNKTVAG